MKAYSTVTPELTHTKKGITYININVVEQTITDEVTEQEITQFEYDSMPVVNGNFISAGIRAKYSWDDEIALINNYNADNTDADGEYATYQAYRAEVKSLFMQNKMETSDIVLTLVGIVSTISIGVFKWIIKEIGRIDDKMDGCQLNLNKEFVRKTDYTHQIDKIEAKLDKIIEALGKK